MGAAGYFYLALLVLVLIPFVVLPSEHKAIPNWLYLTFAACGVAGAIALGGWSAALLSATAAIGCLILATAAVSALQSRTGSRILTGGQIKLLAAGGTWLGVGGSIAMVVLATITLFLVAAVQRMGAVSRRPDASVIVAVVIVSVAMQQQLSGM